MKDKFKEYKVFYKGVLAITLPIMLQNGITNFVSLLDNIMIGRVGTEQMSGVAIVNQLMFVFNLCIFGAISGAGIFTAQFYGQDNQDGVRDTFRLKMVISLALMVIATIVFCVMGPWMISMFLHEGSSAGDLAATLVYGKNYMYIMMIGMLPFVVGCVYSGTLRECGETVIPMYASVSAVLVNLVLNYILIYGKLGLPAMGVAGAATATVISRFVEMLVVMIYTHTHSQKYQFIKGAYKTFRVMEGLTGKVIKLGFPLLANETLWSAGIAVQNQAYSVRGLSVVAGLNINSTIQNVFCIALFAMGDAVAIIVGQLLGAGKLKEAKKTAYRIIAFGTAIGVVCGILLYITAPLFPQIYNTSDEVKELARQFLRVTACVLPIMAFLHATYFTIRSGGKTVITFLFDSCFLWVVSVPLAYYLSKYTTVNIVTVFLACCLVDGIKSIVGFILLKSGVWMNNIVDETGE